MLSAPTVVKKRVNRAFMTGKLLASALASASGERFRVNVVVRRFASRVARPFLGFRPARRRRRISGSGPAAGRGSWRRPRTSCVRAASRPPPARAPASPRPARRGACQLMDRPRARALARIEDDDVNLPRVGGGEDVARPMVRMVMNTKYVVSIHVWNASCSPCRRTCRNHALNSRSPGTATGCTSR